MSAPDKCPRCSAPRVNPLERTGSLFACQSATHFNGYGFFESWDCVISQRDQLAARVKELEDAGRALADAVERVQDWSGTHVGDCCDAWRAKESKP